MLQSWMNATALMCHVTPSRSAAQEMKERHEHHHWMKRDVAAAAVESVEELLVFAEPAEDESDQDADPSSAFARSRDSWRTGVENLHEVVNAAFEGPGEPQDHREARHLHAALKVADEWVTRTAPVGELSLRQLPREAKFAQALAEDHAFIRDRQNALLLLTNG